MYIAFGWSPNRTKLAIISAPAVNPLPEDDWDTVYFSGNGALIPAVQSTALGPLLVQSPGWVWRVHYVARPAPGPYVTQLNEQGQLLHQELDNFLPYIPGTRVYRPLYENQLWFYTPMPAPPLE